jgi:hypothetical protein
MAKSTPKTAALTVADFMASLDHPLKKVVSLLRETILNAAPLIGEQIKWNSPSFFYTGDMKPFDPKEYKRDMVVMNLHKKEYVLLVFPTGAKVKVNSSSLEGSYTDGRRVMKVLDLKDAASKKAALEGVIREWLQLVDQ